MFKSTNEEYPITFKWLDELETLVKRDRIRTLDSIKNKFEDVKREMESITEGKINEANYEKIIKSRQFQSSLDSSNQKYYSFYSVLLLLLTMNYLMHIPLMFLFIKKI